MKTQTYSEAQITFLILCFIAYFVYSCFNINSFPPFFAYIYFNQFSHEKRIISNGSAFHNFYKKSSCSSNLTFSESSVFFDKPLRFYIDDYFDDAFLYKCFKSWFDDVSLGFDDKDNPERSEHVVDFYFNRLLRKHHNRVYDIEHADLVFLNISWMTMRLYQQCYTTSRNYGSLTDWQIYANGAIKKDMDLIVDHLKNLLKLIDSKTRIAIIHQFWATNFLSSLTDLVNSHPSRFIIGMGETFWGHYNDKVLTVKLPYKATCHVEVDDFPISKERKDLFYFAGNCNRREWGRSVNWRNKVLNGSILQHEDQGYIKCKTTNEIVYNKIDFYNQSTENIEHMLNAKFCLVPAGDTPTSRRLFDAIATGCIPIYLGFYEKLIPELPFHRSINWEELVLFAGDMKCYHEESNVKELIDLLKSLAWDVDIHDKLRRSFKRHLSLVSPSLIDAFLEEARFLMSEECRLSWKCREWH